MTISSTNRKAGPYAGNDVATAFPFSFKVFSANDLYVVRADATGAETVLTLTANYTVALNADQDTAPGGSIVLPAPLASTNLLTITSSAPNLQALDLTNQGGFYPKVINTALDRLTILVQQVVEQVGRAVKTPISSGLTPDQLIADLYAVEANAGNSATAAANSAANAAASAAAAAAALDNFDDRYLGEKTSDPTLDNDGNPLATGALYFNTVSGVMRVYTGTSWIDAAMGVNSDDVAYLAPATGAASRTVQDKLREIVSVKDYGAVGDGLTDDTAAIDTAIAASLGRKLYFPSGTYLTNGIVITDLTGVHLEGEDKYSTVIKSNAGINDHVVSYANAFDCSIENITVDQNSAGKTGGHGVRLGGIDGLTMRNFIIKSARSYGIGAQAGANKNIIISDFEIYDCGQDGIDIKDYALDNANIVISNGIIRDYGKQVANQVAFDVRGPAVVSNIQITAQKADNYGFRIRTQSVQGRAGFGTFSNIFINGAGVGVGGFFVEAVSNTNYTISNVVAENCGLLGVVNGTAGLIKNISITGAFSTEALSIFAVDTVFDGVSIDGGSNRNIDFESGATGNLLRNFVVRGVTAATQAIRIQATADNNVIADGIIAAGSTIGDSASGTIIREVRNWKTATNILSTSFPVDSTGTKALIVPHGLAVTPRPEDVQLAVVTPTGGATDWQTNLLSITGSPNSNNVSVRCVVDVASATPGATANFAISVRANGS